MVKRKVRGRDIIVLGRVYRIDEGHRDVNDETVFVDDDGVCRTDAPKWGIYTSSSVRVYWPGRYDYFTTAHIAE